MKKGFKRLIAGGLAAVMTVSLIVTGSGSVKKVDAAELVQDSASAVNYGTILGRGVDYGIIADKFLQMNHMESTLAVETFSNYKNDFNTIDLIEAGSTAQLLIGGVDTSRAQYPNSEAAKRPIYIDRSTAGTLNIEGSPAAMQNFDGTRSGGYFNIDNVLGSGTKILTTTNSDTVANIQKIYQNAFESSATLSAKANNPDYVVNYRNYMEGKTLRFGDEFKNKVIYINVDNELLQKMKDAQGISIIKDETSVIVFNISDNSGTNSKNGIHIDKYDVSVDGGKSFILTDSYSDRPVAGMTTETDKNDLQICQKIIWNITSHENVTLGNSSGLFIVPNSPLVDVIHTCAGWIVAENLQNNGGEWHYIYRGGNQNVLDDGVGQIHFAARKSFTHAYNGKDTLEDTTIYAEKDDYSFNWYETERNYDITGKTPQVVSNESTNKIQFPKLEFYNSKTKTKYDSTSEPVTRNFTINMGGGSATLVDWDEGNKPFFEAARAAGSKVTFNFNASNNGRLTFKNTWSPATYSYPVKAGWNSIEIDSEDLVACGQSINFSSNAGIYQIDAALEYDKVTVTTSTVNLDPSEMKYYIPNGQSKEFFYVINEVDAGKSKNHVTNSTGDIKIRLVVTNNGGTLSYTVDSETTLGDKSIYKTNKNVKMSGVEFSLGSFFNLYNETTALDILKKTENGSVLKGAELEVTCADSKFKFTDANLSLGTDAAKVSVTDKKIVFKSGTTATTIQNLPDGVYYIKETGVPDGYVKVDNATVTIEGDKVINCVFDTKKRSIDSSWSEATDEANATVVLVDKFTPKFGSLVISKTISGAPLNELEDIAFDVTSKDSNAKEVSVPNLKFANVGTIIGQDWIDEGNGKYTFTIDNLPENVTYNVSETLDGHNITYSLVSSTSNGSAKIIGKDIQTVELTNNYKKNTSKLVISKEFAGLGEDLKPGDDRINGLKFTITTEIDGQTYYVKPVFKSQLGKFGCRLSTDPTSLFYGAFYNDGSENLIEFDEVPYGTYTIKEEDGSVIGYTLSKIEVVDGEDTEETNTKSVTLDNSTGEKVTFKNTYSPETGSIKITKTIEGPVTDNDLKNLTFVVKDSSDVQVFKGTLGEFTKDDDGNYVATISDLDVNQTYTVTETLFDVTGRDVEVSYKIGADGTTQSGNAATDIDVDANDTTEVFFTDVYQKNTGNLIITKSIDGQNLTESEFKSALKFQITTKVDEKTMYVNRNGKLVSGKTTFTMAQAGFKKDVNGIYTKTFTDLPFGTYEVTETNSDVPGYTLKSTSVTDGKSAIALNQDATVDLKDEYDANEHIVKISKVDAVNGQEIPGATIVLKDKDDQVIDTWISIAGGKEFSVKPGTYKLEETVAPTGYDKVESIIEFTVDKKGNVILDSAVSSGVCEYKNGQIVIKNQPEKTYDINVSKVDADNLTKEIGGAQIKVTKDDEDKTLVDSWTSVDNKTHKITGVTAGDYILTEKVAPEGYDLVTTEIKFNVSKDGKVTLTGQYSDGEIEVTTDGKLILKDKKTPEKTYDINVSKVDADNLTKEIGGAQIKVTKDDEDKTLVDSWTSV
ncbi:MAG: hypothetical protein IKS48_06465, partial [Eubacterium sp.]|nr:hypothetical protein [Eubacterium sp.]